MEVKIVGAIVSRIEAEGFTILQSEHTRLTEDTVEMLYGEHKERPFYGELSTFMRSGPVVVMKLARENAVAHWRKVLGATDPREAAPGTLRKAFGNHDGIVCRNVAHGSDSMASAKHEASIWWP